MLASASQVAKLAARGFSRDAGSEWKVLGRLLVHHHSARCAPQSVRMPTRGGGGGDYYLLRM